MNNAVLDDRSILSDLISKPQDCGPSTTKLQVLKLEANSGAETVQVVQRSELLAKLERIRPTGTRTPLLLQEILRLVS
jgi:hypothetical protein